MCTSFCANARPCACQATDRDLERVSAVKKMNAWICTSLRTDRDLDISGAIKRVNSWKSALLTSDHDPRKSVTTVIFTGPNVFGIIKFRNNFSVYN